MLSSQPRYGHQSKTYRLLVSRGATQRLHSLTLGNDLSGDATKNEGEEDWIRLDRQFSRAKVEEELHYLGVPWSMYPPFVFFGSFLASSSL